MSEARALQLIFAGNGIFRPDGYRERVATFSTDANAEHYGPMFVAAPDMLAALKAIRDTAQDANHKSSVIRARVARDIIRWADNAIAKAKLNSVPDPFVGDVG